MERIVADTLYAKNGAIDDSLACHVNCFAKDTVGRLHFVDPSWIAPREGTNGDLRYFSTWNFDGALRAGQNKLRTAQEPSSLHMAQNTLGVESLLYSYRMAFQSPTPKGPEFDDYWGRLQDDEGCVIDPTARRCTTPQLSTRFGIDPSTYGSDPFRVKFVQANGVQRTEAMTVHGDYSRRYTSAPPDPDGHGVLDRAEEQGRDFMASQGASGKGIIAAFDLTDVWRDERYNVDYGVVMPADAHFRHGYKVT